MSSTSSAIILIVAIALTIIWNGPGKGWVKKVRGGGERSGGAASRGRDK